MINLHSPYLDSTSSDILSRLKLGKTLFNNQLFKIGLTDTNSCNICTREYDNDSTEDYRHALYQCPAVQTIIVHLITTLFPDITTNFTISDIPISTNKDKHILYKGPTGIELTNLIWNLFQVYILQCRNTNVTPIATIAISEIRSQISRIVKLLPSSKVATLIKTSHELQHIFQIHLT